MKPCTKCGEEKPLDDFHRDRSRKDGRHRWCKECLRQRRNEWYWKNRETNLAYQAEWREANVEKKRASDKRWREANPERKRATDAASRERRKEELADYFRDYFQANKNDPAFRAKRQEVKRRRRAREYDAYVEAVVFDTILLRDLGHCGICGKPIMELTIELDHIIPLVAGGTHEPDNIQLAHRTCNRRKSSKVNFTLKEVA